jgi:hypothetical protein
MMICADPKAICKKLDDAWDTISTDVINVLQDDVLVLDEVDEARDKLAESLSEIIDAFGHLATLREKIRKGQSR